MTRPDDFLELYLAHRLQDQLTWYQARRGEFEHATSQLVTLIGLLLVLASAAGALAAADIAGQRLLWSVLATAFPALSTALSAYAALYGFERAAKLYGDAANALDRVHAQAPEPAPGVPATALHSYVAHVEEIFRKEQGQWGQLIGETRPGEPGGEPESRS